MLVVLIDDAGFGNPGTFGGPIAHAELHADCRGRPALQPLPRHRAVLADTAALLTGRNSHAVGFGSVGEFAGGFPGYSATLPRTARRCPGSSGTTGTAPPFGKWHLTPDGQQGPAGPFDRWPNGWGFDYFYGFLGGGSSQWDPCLAENQKIIGTPGVLRQGEPVLPSGRHGGQDHRVAARRPGPGRGQAVLRLLLHRLQPRPHHVARRGRTSTRASSTRAGTGCARRRSRGRRRSA